MKRKSRNTRQRELLSEEIKKFDSFFTAEDLVKKANKKDPRLGASTVYRFLNDSINKREIHSYYCNGRALYSRENNSHCHFVCEKTGKIVHFNIKNLDFLKEIKNEIPGKIKSFQLEIKGVCDECAQS